MKEKSGKKRKIAPTKQKSIQNNYQTTHWTLSIQSTPEQTRAL